MLRFVKGLGIAVVVTLGVLVLAPAATAQYQQNFELLSASAAGVPLPNQDDWFTPVTSPASVDFLCYLYAGNAVGFPANPEGGDKFIAGTGPGGAYARAEHYVDFTLGIWVIEYDFAAHYSGAVGAGTNNIGSMSMRLDPADTYHINILTWVDPLSPTLINSGYIHYTVGGVMGAAPGDAPGPAWSNLPADHWFRGRTVVDLALNRIIEVGIRDLSGGPESVVNPVDWYLIGGGAGAPGGLPQIIRFFGGGGGAGNTSGWDNVSVTAYAPPQGACCDVAGLCTMTAQSACQPPSTWLAGVTCASNPCPPVPTESTSWGQIKNSYR
jgi:hypothetical protein